MGHLNMKVTGMCLTREQTQGSFGVGFCTKKWVIKCEIQKMDVVWSKLPKIRSHLVWGQILTDDFKNAHALCEKFEILR